MAPRLFWRRVAALLIDLLIASALSTLLALPFLGNTDKVRLSGGILRQTNCGTVNNLPPETLAVLPAKIDYAAACQTWFYGLDAGLTLTVVFDRVVTEHTSSQKSVSLPIDAQGRVVWPWSPDAIVDLLLLTLASAFALSRWGKTPGKYVMGLVVSPRPTLGAALLREALRLWPLHLSNLSVVLTPFLGPHLHSLLQGMKLSVGLFLTAGLFGLLTLGFFLVPLIRWRGAMPWDRIAGTTVQRG
jgi:hypothetical protein